MWIHERLYESLPLIYVVAGLGCIAIFGLSAAAIFSALLFSATACLILWKRHHARRSVTAHRRGGVPRHR